jgi:hypothetical protein
MSTVLQVHLPINLFDGGGLEAVYAKWSVGDQEGGENFICPSLHFFESTHLVCFSDEVKKLVWEIKKREVDKILHAIPR